MASRRLHWQRYGPGFIAHPEGQTKASRYCWLRPHTNASGAPSGMWTFTLCCDGRERSGTCSDKQAASDAANEEWPRFLADLVQEAVEERASTAFAALAKELDASNRPVGSLKLQEASRPLLLRTLKEVRPGRVQDAISRELFRRRTQEGCND